MDEKEMFKKIGQVLVPGLSWQGGLADLIGVRPETVRQWGSGHLRLRKDHFETLLTLLETRRKVLAETEKDLRDWLTKFDGPRIG